MADILRYEIRTGSKRAISIMNADLYLDRIGLFRYFPKIYCRQCNERDCVALLDAIKRGEGPPDWDQHLSKAKQYAFEIGLKAEEFLPEVPLLQTPRAGLTGLVEINNPESESPLIVSGNSETTQEVLLALFSMTTKPFFLLFADSDGNTVDMAMIFKTFTAERVMEAIEDASIQRNITTGPIIIPGLAFSIAPDLGNLLSLTIDVGPVCAGELPLFLGDLWGPPLK
jgi:CO dehydrogenase/acetyl-CoA synthase gamma subunit (corrinoid Fe-S protein)